MIQMHIIKKIRIQNAGNIAEKFTDNSNPSQCCMTTCEELNCCTTPFTIIIIIVSYNF